MPLRTLDPRQAQEALAYSESRYRTLVEHSPVGIWHTTPQGETLYVNRVMCDLLEIDSPAEMAGKTYKDFFSPASIATVQREHAKRLRGEASNYEVEVFGARGARRHLLIHGAPVSGGDGTINSFIATITDVTAERQSRRLLETAQEQVRRLNAELEARVLQRTRDLAASNAQLESFCYTVSHDLKAPLRAICSFSQILEEDLASTLSPECLQGLKAISTSALRMDQLLQDLLHFTRISRMELELRPVDPTALLEKIVHNPDLFAAETSFIAEPLPLLLAHEVALEQVFTNLIGNAQKFARTGVAPAIRVFCNVTGPRARIFVEDNGIGIAPEHCGRIFRVFERLHSQNQFPGTGVGLAIVKTYVEKMGGSVGVDSTVGAGSRFWIELPLAHSRAVPNLGRG